MKRRHAIGFETSMATKWRQQKNRCCFLANLTAIPWNQLFCNAHMFSPKKTSKINPALVYENKLKDLAFTLLFQVNLHEFKPQIQQKEMFGTCVCVLEKCNFPATEIWTLLFRLLLALCCSNQLWSRVIDSNELWEGKLVANNAGIYYISHVKNSSKIESWIWEEFSLSDFWQKKLKWKTFFGNFG